MDPSDSLIGSDNDLLDDEVSVSGNEEGENQIDNENDEDIQEGDDDEAQEEEEEEDNHDNVPERKKSLTSNSNNINSFKGKSNEERC